MVSQATEGFDRVFNYVGSNGRYQILLLLTVSLQGAILSWHHLSYVFLGAVPSHYCKVSGFENSDWSQEEIRNFSIPMKSNGQGYESCEYYDLNYTLFSLMPFQDAMTELGIIQRELGDTDRKPCDNEWIFDHSIYLSTLVTDFGIVCHRRYLVATIQASYMCGVFMGSLIIGSLSDRVIGRRKSVLISIVMVLSGGMAASFANSYLLLILFRFFVAFGAAGAYQNCYVLMMEYTGPKSRSTVGMIQQLPFAMGYMLMALYAYYIRDWQNLMFAFTVSGFVLLTYFWALPESARWLAVSGQSEKSLQLLLEVARTNGKGDIAPGPIFEIVRSCSEVKTRRTTTPSMTDGSPPIQTNTCLESLQKVWTLLKDATLVYWSLLATPEMRRRTLLIWVLFISVDLVYYGVVFDSATLTNDPYLLVFLGGLSEIPAYTVFVPCLSRWGRRPTIVLTFLCTTFCTLLVAYLPTHHEMLRMCMSMLGKLFITTAFAVIYLLGTELYPTSTRTTGMAYPSTGLAASVFMGRVGSILAPYVVDGMKSVYSDLPSIIFGVVCLFSGLVSFLIPETNGTEMADQLLEVEEGFASARRKSQSNNLSLHELPQSTSPKQIPTVSPDEKKFEMQQTPTSSSNSHKKY